MIASKFVDRSLFAALVLTLVGLVACESGTEQDASVASAPVQADGSPGTTEGSAEEEPRRAVLSDELPYAEIGDELVYGHFVFPTDMIDPLPAVVLIHDRWGLTDAIRARADELASEGFIVLAVDLFRGKTTKNPAEARVFMAAAIEDPDAVADNIRNAIEFVNMTAGAPGTATLGMGFGGTWAVNAASLQPDEVQAAIVYYGQVTSDEDKLRPVKAPILGLYGGKDRVVNPESVETLRATLDRLRLVYEIQVYPEARGGFANPASSNFNRAATRDSWRRTLAFLRTHLAESAEDS